MTSNVRNNNRTSHALRTHTPMVHITPAITIGEVMDAIEHTTVVRPHGVEVAFSYGLFDSKYELSGFVRSYAEGKYKVRFTTKAVLAEIITRTGTTTRGSRVSPTTMSVRHLLGTR